MAPRRRPLELAWTERALADLEAIGAFIARDDPAAAARWIARLTSAAARAASVPRAGRRVPELARDDLREVLVRSYRVVFRVDAGRCVVLTVFEGHRLLPDDVAESQDEG